MSRCDEYQELISRMVDDDLTARQRASLEEHIRNCADCAALYNAFSALSRQIGEDLEDVPLDLRENVMAEVRREEIRRKNRLPRALRGVLAAAACVAVIIGVSLGVSPNLRGRISAAAYPKMAAETKETSVEEAIAEEPAFSGEEMDRAAFYGTAAATEMTEDAAPAAEEAAEEAAAGEPRAEEPRAEGPAADNAVQAVMPDALDTGEEDGAQVHDLSGWMDSSLLRELVGSEPADLTREELGDPAWILQVKDGDGVCEFLFVELDGKLYYWDPAEKAVFQARLSPEEFEDFLRS